MFRNCAHGWGITLARKLTKLLHVFLNYSRGCFHSDNMAVWILNSSSRGCKQTISWSWKTEVTSQLYVKKYRKLLNWISFISLTIFHMKKTIKVIRFLVFSQKSMKSLNIWYNFARLGKGNISHSYQNKFLLRSIRLANNMLGKLTKFVGQW
jgi:hypothetical protein